MHEYVQHGKYDDTKKIEKHANIHIHIHRYMSTFVYTCA